MAHDSSVHLEAHETQPVGARARNWSVVLLIAGAILLLLGLLAAGLLCGDPSDGLTRYGYAYVAGFAFALSIALGCLILVLLTHLFRAGWVVVVRRVIECHAAAVCVLPVLFVPILIYVFSGTGVPYPWAGAVEHHGEVHEEEHLDTEHQSSTGAPIILAANAEHQPASDGHAAPAEHAQSHGPGQVDHEVNITYGEYGDPVAAKQHDMAHMIAWKRPFLNTGMFVLLWVVFFVVWSVLGVWYLRTSMKQDETKDPKLTNQREAAAPIGTILFAFTSTFAAFTLLMSMDPTWYSTMYGVYYFSGSMIAALSTLILVLMALERAGVLASVTLDHYHDLGKLLFAFVVFWAYIAYSQYMLIWYGAIPAEQPWTIIRGLSTAHPSDWQAVAVFMLFGHFLVPFLFLLSRHVKRNRVTLAIGAGWMLLAHGVDIFWLVLPELSYPSLVVPIPEVLCMAGATAVLLGAAAWFGSTAAPVAHGDPRLTDSLNFRNY